MIFAEPRRLIMDDAGLAVMNDLRRHLFDLEQASGGLATGFQSFVGNYTAWPEASRSFCTWRTIQRKAARTKSASERLPTCAS